MIVMYPATIGDLFTPANNFNWRKERCACIQAEVGKNNFLSLCLDCHSLMNFWMRWCLMGLWRSTNVDISHQKIKANWSQLKVWQNYEQAYGWDEPQSKMTNCRLIIFLQFIWHEHIFFSFFLSLIAGVNMMVKFVLHALVTDSRR